ncbi:winged helix-turn-helix transcriptional regulator [Streptomonospora nanhaiensis]|uniref:DNA-binding HxlR family transcriptional regulator n=1 Tax=Streptomonospora nanhaiensis TaxID=1323731 RepID=A0A853BR74_9ACTN|nr:helix-turn-helix domain-containing protein [Streptomonospora nanhaiensis]MBV2363989.1 helix-turn-helix transcriptional regulator [Streptomonospora nanhaiensis]MBX9387333.1 helix-turn-helix transcriptional regulator [Streptomonospora nanhaiensis]NYI96991.1 DNA-binding HxlR family transcriptional regulator [Streptomonospora nanhaiensis]
MSTTAPKTGTDTGTAPPTGDPEFDVFARACPSRPVLEHLTGRWGVLVLTGLHARPARFNALRRRIDGVSEKMLAQTLQALERDGFVHREVHAVMPPRVEYSLTDLGRTTAEKLLDLIDHLEGHMPAVLAAQRRYDDDHAGAGR